MERGHSIDFESTPLMRDVMRGSMETCIGVIGDMVGSGKSYVILSLVMMDDIPVSSRRTTHVMGFSRITVRKAPTLSVCTGNTLIVIPHNISLQWEEYVRTFSPDLSMTMLNRTNSFSNLNVVDLFRSKRLVIVTAPFYNQLARMMMIHGVSLRRLVFDEADTLRIPACCYVENDFTWFVTASYGNLLYPKGYYGRAPGGLRDVIYASGLTHSGYIRQVFSDLYNSTTGRQIAKVLVIRNNDDFVRASINLPAITELTVKCIAPRYISMLYGYVDNGIIERLNAGDVDGAIQLMNPENCTTTENIVNVFVTRYESQLERYVRRVDACKRLVQEFSASDASEERTIYDSEIASMTTKIKELQQKIDGIRSRVSDDECNICLGEIRNKTLVKCCVIPMCFECIHKWMQINNRCPFCKKFLTKEDIVVVRDENVERIQRPQQDVVGGVHVDPSKDKLFNLEQIIKSKKDDADARFLICSSYDGSFESVSRILRKLEMPYSFLKGNTAHVNSMVHGFQEGRIRVLLANSTNYGSGMNLACTTDIVMFHRFENELRKQVIGRAQRYGRTESLRVWYLLHDNEIV